MNSNIVTPDEISIIPSEIWLNSVAPGWDIESMNNQHGVNELIGEPIRPRSARRTPQSHFRQQLRNVYRNLALMVVNKQFCQYCGSVGFIRSNLFDNCDDVDYCTECKHLFDPYAVNLPSLLALAQRIALRRAAMPTSPDDKYKTIL